MLQVSGEVMFFRGFPAVKEGGPCAVVNLEEREL
jgi:hypothetical protein